MRQKHKTALPRLFALGLIILAFVACAPGGAPSEPPTAEVLANMEYSSEFTQSGTAPLENGEYSEQAAPGSATETKVMLTDYVAVGELNGQPAAAVVLVTDPGGSGTFYTLHVVMEENGQPVDVASTLLGDRAQINSVSMMDDQIVVDMVTHGTDDPMCCPTQQVVKTYELRDGQLVETSSEEVGSSQDALVTGTVTYRQRIALPEDAVVQVQLRDVSEMDVASQLMGEEVIQTNGKQVPIPYTVTYDPAEIDQRNTYSMSARIEDGSGKLLWISDTATPVITRGSPTQDVEIVVVQVGSP